MVDVRETKWFVSPLQRGGWWTKGLGRDRVLDTGVGEKTEYGDCICEEEEETIEACPCS